MTPQEQKRAIALNVEDFMLGRVTVQQFRRRAAEIRERKRAAAAKRRAS
jgi:hypothetical protein